MSKYNIGQIWESISNLNIFNCMYQVGKLIMEITTDL